MPLKYNSPHDSSTKAIWNALGRGLRYTVFALFALWWLYVASCSANMLFDEKRLSAFNACLQSDIDTCMAAKGYERFNLACGNRSAECYVSRWNFWRE